jgi:hypothetical protein
MFDKFCEFNQFEINKLKQYTSKLIIRIINSLSSFFSLPFINKRHSNFTHPINKGHHPLKQSQQPLALIFVNFLIRKVDNHSQGHWVPTEFINVAEVN